MQKQGVLVCFSKLKELKKQKIVLFDIGIVKNISNPFDYNVIKEIDDIYNCGFDSLYCHSLNYFGLLIIFDLLKKNFEYSETDEKQTFKSIISLDGTIREIKIRMHNTKISIYNSTNIIPFSMKKISSFLNAELTKTRDEDGLHSHADILIDAIKKSNVKAKSLTAQCKQNFYNSCKRYKSMFPNLNFELSERLREFYPSGFCMCNADRNKLYTNIIELDYNSMYPYIMQTKDLPYGYPLYKQGYSFDKNYPLSLICIAANLVLKKNKLPILFKKNHFSISQDTKIFTTNGNIETFFITNLDLKLIYSNYDIYYIEFLYSFNFKSCRNVFDSYLNDLIKEKENENTFISKMAKQKMNLLVGSFGQHAKKINKIPYLNSLHHVSYRISRKELSESGYIPIPIFVISYGRNMIVDFCQTYYNTFLYSDTDSAHLNMSSPPIEVDDKKTGMMKCKKIEYARYIGEKKYIQQNGIADKKIVCAGLSEVFRGQIDVFDFKPGASIEGNIVFLPCEGGFYIKALTYEL